MTHFILINQDENENQLCHKKDFIHTKNVCVDPGCPKSPIRADRPQFLLLKKCSLDLKPNKHNILYKQSNSSRIYLSNCLKRKKPNCTMCEMNTDITQNVIKDPTSCTFPTISNDMKAGYWYYQGLYLITKTYGFYINCQQYQTFFVKSRIMNICECS